MSPLLIIFLVIAALILISNWPDIARSLRPPKPEAPPEQLDLGEFALLKPAGFSTATATYSKGRRLFAAEIYSESKAGVIGTVDGRSVREEFNHAWAVVSVAPGDVLEICRSLAKKDAEAVLSESEESVADGRILTITAIKRSVHFRIETTHKAIVSDERNKTYELRASVLSDRKAEYIDDINAIVASFQLT